MLRVRRPAAMRTHGTYAVILQDTTVTLDSNRDNCFLLLIS